MDDDNLAWRKVDALFEGALDLPPAERRAFLDARCPNPEIRARVEALLDAEVRSAPFLRRRRLVARALARALREQNATPDPDDDGPSEEGTGGTGKTRRPGAEPAPGPDGCGGGGPTPS